MHFGHVADAHGQGGIGAYHDVADVFQAGDGAFRAHHQHFLAVIEPACAVIAVVHFQGIAQLGKADAPRGHAGVVRHYLEGAHQAAQGVHVGHAGHRTQGGTYHPVQQVTACFQVQITAVQGEHEHLAQGRGEGGDAAVDIRGQITPDAGQAFGYLLPRPVHVRAFLEVHGDVRQGVFGDGA